MKLIDFPHFVPSEEYEILKKKLVNDLSQFPQIKSIYQLGSIKEPGISDLDILCVFEDDFRETNSILPELKGNEKYILTHSLFGIKKTELNAIRNLNFYTNYVLLSGEDLQLKEAQLSEVLKTQIALEFLLMFYISLTRQLEFFYIKVRAFLLEAKAIQFDLDLLNIIDSPLNALVDEVIELRKNYFKQDFNAPEFIVLVKKFHTELEIILKNTLEHTNFYAPKKTFFISKKIQIKHSDIFYIEHKGLRLPFVFSFLGKNYAKINNRLSSIEIKVPIHIAEENSELEKRFSILEKIHKSNKKDYPTFIPLTTKLDFFR